jgi:hypothetical protein
MQIKSIKRYKLNKNKEAEDDTTSTQLLKKFLEAMAIVGVKSMPLNRLREKFDDKLNLFLCC